MNFSPQDDAVLDVSAGSDFTVAVSETGTVFGWGSNLAGQLGKPPIEMDGTYVHDDIS